MHDRTAAPLVPHVSKEKYFRQTARRFMLDAKMLRCRAAIHVENRDDIVFWSTVLQHFRPRDRFHFIAGSRNENGHETHGVTQCLKYLPYLGPGFLICIDSDYRHLLHEPHLDPRHFVLQTYTYSFENHHCFADGLNDVCRRVTTLPNDIFDFRRYLSDYSRAVHELFLWHIYLLQADPSAFTASDFNELISLDGCRRPDIRRNGRNEIARFARRARNKTNRFRAQYPDANLSPLRSAYRDIGLTPDTTYLFIRGHNIYDMVYAITREVCKTLLRRAKERHPDAPRPADLFARRHSVDEELRRNLRFGAYPAIRRVENDIRQLF